MRQHLLLVTKWLRQRAPRSGSKFNAPQHRFNKSGRVALAPSETPLPFAHLGEFDVVSGGAIAHVALYALSRIPGVRGIARVIEPDSYDLSNLNRDELLLRSSVGSAKADHLSHMNLGDVDIKPVPLRYEAAHRGEVGSLAPVVLVGVDHVESRWAVQEERPAWLGIGATEEYFALLSVHGGDLPCAKCVHEGGVAPDGPMPTAAFVSHWGGLALAAGFVRHRLGIDPAVGEQVTRITCLRPGTSAGLWRTRGYVREGCRTCGRPWA